MPPDGIEPADENVTPDLNPLSELVDDELEKQMERLAELRQSHLEQDHAENTELDPLPTPPGFSTDLLGENLFAEWCYAFSQYSVNNGFFGSGAFHLVFGQMPTIRNISVKEGHRTYDSRIHLAFMAPTSAGKGEGWLFINEMCELLDLKTQSIDETNNAALIGSDTKTSDGAEMKGEGWFNPNNGVNIFCFSEASNVIKDPKDRDPSSQPMMNTFQKVMNDMGTKDNQLSKKLTYGELIEYNPTCSLMFTSFILDYMNDLIIKRGLFQRMYFYIREVTTADRLNDLLAIKRLKNTNTVVLKDMQASVAARLRAIDQAYSTAGIEVMEYSPGAAREFEDALRAALERITELHPLIQDMMNGFVTRFQKLQLKIALHFACLNLHRRVERSDAELAIRYTEKLLESLVNYFQLRVEPARGEVRVFRQVTSRVSKAIQVILKELGRDEEQHVFVRVERLKEVLIVKNRIAAHTCDLYLKKLTDWGIAEFRENDGKQFFRISKEIPELDDAPTKTKELNR